jgi:ribosome-associated protein
MIDVRVLRFRNFAASSGPGGQHVNKVASAVELRCDIRDLGLPERVEERLRGLLGRRISADGEVVLVGKERASAAMNRAEVFERLVDLVLEARKIPKKRRPTKPTKGSKERRLEGKKIRANVKKGRKVSVD